MHNDHSKFKYLMASEPMTQKAIGRKSAEVAGSAHECAQAHCGRLPPDDLCRMGGYISL